MRTLLAFLVAAPLLVGHPALARSSSKSSTKKSGPTCKKGKPCGNSCIARDKVCHQPEGTARAAEDVEKENAAQQR